MKEPLYKIGDRVIILPGFSSDYTMAMRGDKTAFIQNIFIIPSSFDNLNNNTSSRQ